MSLRKILKKKKHRHRKTKDTFYRSKEWRDLRYQKLREVRYCECCGRTAHDTTKGGQHVKLTVDHIKPRSKYPELAYKLENLQVLCSECNEGKDSIYEDDFRIVQEEEALDNYSDFDDYELALEV